MAEAEVSACCVERLPSCGCSFSLSEAETCQELAACYRTNREVTQVQALYRLKKNVLIKHKAASTAPLEDLQKRRLQGHLTAAFQCLKEALQESLRETIYKGLYW